MKKILMVCEAFGGGVFTYIVDLANELANVYDIYIAHSVRNQTPDNYMDYFDKRIHLLRINNFCRSVNPIKDVKVFFEIRNMVRKVKPDCIHLHSSKAGVIGRLAFNGKRIPLFYTPHGYSFLMQNQSMGKRILYKMIEIICGKRCCTTICCSEGEYRESLKLTTRTTYVNNGINICELQKLMSDVKIHKNKVLTVFTLGRICPQKNPKLFNEIAEAMPNVKFVWIGDGELRYELKAKNIAITGWVERKGAIEHSMQGDVFILTSLWEGLPISLLEAMYMKKLCVVSNVIGNNDVIHSGDNGFVCRNVDEFVSAIRAKLCGEVNDIVEKAYMDVIENYNTVNVVKKYKTIYEELRM